MPHKARQLDSVRFQLLHKIEHEDSVLGDGAHPDETSLRVGLSELRSALVTHFSAEKYFKADFSISFLVGNDLRFLFGCLDGFIEPLQR
jgi:hypothetical protein